MHIHILGICGTFMAGVAVLAKQQGHHVTGSDANGYPPMSTQLTEQGISVKQGYDPAHLQPAPDCVIVGNTMRRGNPVIEYLLDSAIPYYSGPEWLAEHVLVGRRVFAVSGTHGKTTTSSLLAWILDVGGYAPGFLIGGVPENFGVSARLGSGDCFVIEADEYDSAFFDKRSKFMHYRPETLIINNLEFDHADIFENLEAIQRQFHYLVRTVPSKGLLIYPEADSAISDLLAKGYWTTLQSFGTACGDWQAQVINDSGDQFDVVFQNKLMGRVSWSLLGQHNVKNALAAMAAATRAGVESTSAMLAMQQFRSVKRRLEKKGCVRNITLYDDFAHHPTAIATTLSGLRGKVGRARIIVVLELGSYTMRTGVHQPHLVSALLDADVLFFMQSRHDQWDGTELLENLSIPTYRYHHSDDLFSELARQAKTGDHIVIMSNTGFSNHTCHERFMTLLAQVPV